MDITTALGLKDPALSTRWAVRISGTDSRVFIAETIEATFLKIGVKQRYAQARTRSYPETQEVDTLSISFYETIDFDVTKTLQAWKREVVDDNANYGMPSNYWRTVEAILYRQNKNEPILTILYEECWPTEQENFSLTYEDDVGRLKAVAQIATNSQTLIWHNN